MDTYAVKKLLKTIWAWGCSLKLAICIATVATLLIMGGSLIMHKHPEVFGPIDQMLMRDWLEGAWRRAPHLVWWIPTSGFCLILFAINTLCCLIDWLIRIRIRWRKTGEYLILTGSYLLTIASTWNSCDSFRSGPYPIYPGEELNLEHMPDYNIKLESFTPQLSETGRPLDMLNEVSLWHGDTEIKRAQIRINHPLTYEGLVVLPTSFGRSLDGFRFHMPGKGMINLSAGSIMALSNGGTFQALRLLPNVVKSRNGQIIPAGDQVRNPALEILINYPDGRAWQGWYVLRERIPQPMAEADLFIRPVEPIMKTYSLITINRDPGSFIALIGAIFMCLGVFLAFFSFYAKRARGDRPEF